MNHSTSALLDLLASCLKATEDGVPDLHKEISYVLRNERGVFCRCSYCHVPGEARCMCPSCREERGAE